MSAGELVLPDSAASPGNRSMSTSHRTRPHVGSRISRGTLLKILLGCGVLYSLVYVVTNDIVAATLYSRYSRLDQAISELSATGASTRPFLVAMLPVYTALMIAFGIGVWKSARLKPSLRLTGGLLVAFGITGVLWLPFPMTSREEMVTGTTRVNDVGHLVLSAVTVLLILSVLACGAAAFAMRFRLYSIVTAATVLVFGALTSAQAPKVPRGEPTPWMGLYERVSVWAWLLWIAVLAVILMRTRPSNRPR